MFGRNKVSQQEIERLKNIVEIDERFFVGIDDGKDMFEATVSELTESYRQMEACVSQVKENIQCASELAAGNVEVEAVLSRRINECNERVAEKQEQQEQLRQQLHQLKREATRLVDENKHFTSPSKSLGKFPADLKDQNQICREQLDQMEEYSKQMGVLALNAAIEAGRLGDAGKQFVISAEDIRSYASNYDKAIEETRKQLQDSDERIAKLEEQVHHLVSLLKDNNVATARLMKSCSEVVEQADEQKDDFEIGELVEILNQVTTLRNADEEIVKSEERNRMQMEDLAEEFLSQQKSQKEISEMMDPLYRHVIERKAGR